MTCKGQRCARFVVSRPDVVLCGHDHQEAARLAGGRVVGSPVGTLSARLRWCAAHALVGLALVTGCGAGQMNHWDRLPSPRTEADSLLPDSVATRLVQVWHHGVAEYWLDVIVDRDSVTGAPNAGRARCLRTPSDYARGPCRRSLPRADVDSMRFSTGLSARAGIMALLAVTALAAYTFDPNIP
jgi:hypothetical protein